MIVIQLISMLEKNVLRVNKIRLCVTYIWVYIADDLRGGNRK